MFNENYQMKRIQLSSKNGHLWKLNYKDICSTFIYINILITVFISKI